MIGLSNTLVAHKLLDFSERSQDAYAIFDPQDNLSYCNPRYDDLFNIPKSLDQPLSFEWLLRQNYKDGRGIRIDSRDIDAFVEYSKSVRRSRPFRLFEVDFVDGRWFLFSEQLNEEGELLVQIKDITKQKVLQQGLEDSIDSLRSIAMTDELTKVGNRRALVESVNNELARCRRTGASMTLFLVDLDLFKKVNDQYGHQGGDSALKHVATLIKESLRPYDILGRIGGEEFAVFLSNTTQEEGFLIAERTRQHVELHPAAFEGRTIPLSISCGITTLGCNATFESLYAQADEALYQSKNSGRNRVTQYRSKQT